MQVSDDLSDGDCTYLADAGKVGPALLLILQHLFYLVALRTKIPSEILTRTAEHFLLVGTAQTREVRANVWDLGSAKEAASGLNSMQFSAYLQLLWSGTDLARRAPLIGKHLGVAVHVASDIRSRDRRFQSLAARDRRSLVRWAEASAKALERQKLGSIDRVLSMLRAALRVAT